VPEIGQPELLKQLNRRAVMSVLTTAKKISRSEIARRTGLSRASVSILVDELIEAGLAEEAGVGESTGGRPPILVRLKRTSRMVIGAEMVDNEWIIVAVDLAARIQRKLVVSIGNGSAEAALQTLIKGIKELLPVIPVPLLPAIGLGTPGLVDHDTGVIKSAADLGWQDVPVARVIEDELGVPAYVINRHKAGGVAEVRYDRSMDDREIVYIGIGTGIVMALFHEGNLVKGASSSAGELGHTTILPDGPPCPCGNRGCLQQLASGPAMAARARTLIKEGLNSTLLEKVNGDLQLITGKAVCEAAEEGDALALRVVKEAGSYIGISVANIINIYNPDVVIIGGPITRTTDDTLLIAIQEEARKRAMSYPFSFVKIVKARLGPDAGALGAASMVIDHCTDLIFTENTLSTGR